MITVTVERVANGKKEMETATFHTPEGAKEWLRVMQEFYGFRKVKVK